MNALIFTLGYITFVALCVYLINKILVVIKLIIVGKAREYFSQPSKENTDDKHNKVNPPNQISYCANKFIGFLKFVKNEQLVSKPNMINHCNHRDNNLACDKSTHPVSQFINSDLNNPTHDKPDYNRKLKRVPNDSTKSCKYRKASY